MQKKRRTDHSPVRRFFGYTYSIDLQVFFSSDVPTYDFVCRGFTRRFDNLMYKQSRVRTISYPTNLMYNALIVHRGLHTLIHPIWWNTVRRDTRSAGTPFSGAPGLPKYCLTEDYRL